MSEHEEITLAIESAIAGGSISLLRGDVEIANWVGTANVSKAEDLLFNIDLLLTGNEIDRRQITSIAVSAGPGSFTGIRIGIATALGLKAGLGIEMSSESALKAMAFSAGIFGIVTTALPVGRDAVCIQKFSVSVGRAEAMNEPETVTEEAFMTAVGDESSATFLVHERLYEKVSAFQNAVNEGWNLAHSIGRICRRQPGVVVEPIFISKSF
ncbi:MAG: tRNA (adenosine(37)-N6)-threonylcarbamoyltransferase complex dimerization subunit type 1 TsaB [Pyrinomonadaceae bacterium]